MYEMPIHFRYKKISGLSINKEPITKVTKVAWIALADTSPTLSTDRSF